MFHQLAMLTGMSAAGHPAHFGEQVRSRRLQLNMTAQALRIAGGPTHPTISRAEAGNLVEPRPSTLAKFDTCLRWIPGSAARVYWRGELPELATNRHRRRRRVLDPGATTVPVPVQLATELLLNQQILSDLLDDTQGATVPVHALEEVRDRGARAVSTLIGIVVTDLLERNWLDPEAGQPEILESTLGEILDTPVAPDDPDRLEKLYRRWLMGNHDGIDNDINEQFRRRIETRRKSAYGGKP